LKHAFGINSLTSVLIVCDDKNRTVSEGFHNLLTKMTMNCQSFRLGKIDPLSAVPENLVKLIIDSEVIINILDDNPMINKFRVELLKIEKTSGAKIGHGIGLVPALFHKNGPFSIDPKKLERRARIIISLLNAAEAIIIRNPESNSELTLKKGNREFFHDIVCPKSRWINLPFGEVFLAPLELQTEGSCVIYPFAAGYRSDSSEMRLNIREGRVRELKSTKEAEEHIASHFNVDRWSSVLGLFAIGINHGAVWGRSYLETIKASTTCYIAFGENLEAGGLNPSIAQRAYSLGSPTILARMQGGEELVVIKNGRPLCMDNPEDETMVSSAMEALKHTCRIKWNILNSVLIVCDTPRKKIGQAFKIAAERLRANVSLYVLSKKRPLIKVPFALKELLNHRYDAIINLLPMTPEETEFRINLLSLEQTTGARIAHCPGITNEMMRKGPVNIDYRMLQRYVRQIKNAFRTIEKVHITSKLGTDIWLSLSPHRKAWQDALIPKNNWGNLPAGEIWWCPNEETTNGTLICDGSMGPLGQVPHHVKIEIKDGRFITIDCADKAFERRVEKEFFKDDGAGVIGEFGIGLNEGAQITGFLLEDEKVMGTCHLAFQFVSEGCFP